jgi:hypothetical protein
MNVSAPTAEEATATAAHELQHAAQSRGRRTMLH